MDSQKNNYEITQQNIYNYKNYTYVMIFLFIIFLCIYMIMIFKKIN